MSRAVAATETGRLYSVLALFSAVSGSLVESAFQQIYSASLPNWPGLYLTVLAGLVLLTIPVNLVLARLLVTAASPDLSTSITKKGDTSNLAGSLE